MAGILSRSQAFHAAKSFTQPSLSRRQAFHAAKPFSPLSEANVLAIVQVLARFARPIAARALRLKHSPQRRREIMEAVALLADLPEASLGK
jgi:hypothetical protein